MNDEGRDEGPRQRTNEGLSIPCSSRVCSHHHQPKVGPQSVEESEEGRTEDVGKEDKSAGQEKLALVQK